MMRVLVADEYSPIRLLVRAVLEQSGYSVFEAGDGAKAVSSAREFLPDLIILELSMPVLDGFGAVKELRQDRRFAMTPILAFSADGMDGDRERVLSAGFTSYLAKPVRLTLLRGEVERLLGKECSSAGCR